MVHHTAELWVEMDSSGSTTDDNKSSISDLSLNLLASIFSHLDIHHQARAKRICRVWSAVVSGCWPMEHVEINSQLGAQDRYHMYPAEYPTPLDTQEAKVDTMLYIALSARTKTLTLRNIALSHRRIVLLVIYRLKETDRKLPILSFKDCTVGIEMTLYPWQNSVEFSSHNRSNLLLFTHYQPCEKLLLRNHTIRDIMDYPLLFDSTLRFVEGMMRKAGTAGTISRLVVHCGKSGVDVFHILLTALIADWPSVGENVRESVTAIHRQWVQNDENPYKWIAFRSVVNLFTFQCPDAPYRQQHPENHEDMKSLNIAQLNDMTVAFLALLFKAYEANY